MPFISALNPNAPTSSNFVSGGAAELRDIKDTLQDTFPNMDAAMTAAGKSMITAATAAAQRTLLALGTAALLDSGETIGDVVLFQDVGGSPKIPEEFLDLPAAASFMPAGTRMIFNQTAAPTGWTKDTTAALNDTALRLVTGVVGSGGSVAFSTVFARTATDSHTLTVAQIPAHTHTYNETNDNDEAFGASSENPGPGSSSSKNTGSTGTGEGHTHNIDLRVKYRDVIVASKD